MTRIPLEQARAVAQGVMEELLPYVDRVEIAGSIRRGKPTVGDVEIVCIPAKYHQADLFTDGALVTVPGFVSTVNHWEKIKGSPTGRYTQRRLPDGTTLDLFMARPENWGLILAIRTGSKEYSHRVLATRWKKLGYTSVGGMLHDHQDKAVPVREERELFELLKLEWAEPEKREL